jgi:hypothetical protein
MRLVVRRVASASWPAPACRYAPRRVCLDERVVVALDILLAILIALFGMWRLASGLSCLGVIERRVPGRDLFDRHVPKFMRAPDGVSGLVDLVGGGMFLLFAAALVITHPS